MEVKEQSFRDKTFKVAKGSLHPEYSFNTFSLEEKDFREQYWDIKEGDVVFDVGASYGAYTLSAASMGATVYSFEPEKAVYYDFFNNILINGWEDRCFPERIGLWSSGTSSVNMKEYAPHWPEQTITGNYRVKTLDQVAAYQGIQKLDWLKVDVEGAEEEVISGALITIGMYKPNLIIECHTFMRDNIVKNVRELVALSGAEYEFEELDRPPCVMLLGRAKAE